MKNANKFIMVSGPAACGKSTLVRTLNNTFDGYMYSPSKAYIDLSIARGIPVKGAFDNIAQSEAEDYFCQICTEHLYVIGDQHLSIQPNKDSAIASGNPSLVFTEENYVSALDYNLFYKLSNRDIQTFIIYLSASPEVLFERAYSRYLKEKIFIRNKSVDDVIKEVEAENYFFKQLVDKTGLENIKINTDNLTPEEVKDIAVQKILKI